MMHSITNDRAKTDNGTKYTGIRILAVLFWIAIWQFASMYLKPVSYTHLTLPTNSLV